MKRTPISFKNAAPFLLLTFVYFIVGFLTTVNGQCQGPLKVAFLSEVAANKNSLATLVSFSFFLGYLLNSSRTGKMMNRLGYKKTLIRSMVVMVVGVAFYLASALCAEYCSGVAVGIGSDMVPIRRSNTIRRSVRTRNCVRTRLWRSSLKRCEGRRC